MLKHLHAALFKSNTHTLSVYQFPGENKSLLLLYTPSIPQCILLQPFRHTTYNQIRVSFHPYMVSSNFKCATCLMYSSAPYIHI